jgi:hypothetical protein
MAKAYTKIEWKDHVVDSQTGKVLQQGTPVSASNLNHMEDGIDLAHQFLEGANRQTVPLTHGVQVINGDVNAPVSLQMEGRTLIPLQNTELNAAKFYVLADKKTKLKFSESFSVQGIAKFPGVNAKVQVITRTATFEGKVSGSTLKNPHIAGTNYSETLKSPSNVNYPASQAYIEAISKKDSNIHTTYTLEAGKMVQTPFSFNIVEEIERNVGRIPRNTLAEKIQWIKDNVNKAIFQANAYGTGPSGGKLSAAVYRVSTGAFYIATPVTNTALTTTGISIGNGFGVSNIEIDNDGFIHYLLFTEASDGVTRAQIYIDYVELQIELKTGVTLLNPRIPLYEVTKGEYDNILVAWNEEEIQKRYPSVEGVQHLQNPYFLAEGANLLPPFNEMEVSPNHQVIEPYKMISNGIAGSITSYNLSVPKNTDFYFHVGSNDSSRRLAVIDLDTNNYIVNYQYSTFVTFNTGNSTRIRVQFRSEEAVTTFEKPILTLGKSFKPFVPRNPSYMFVEAKLGVIGSYKDTLFEQDGKMMLRKVIEKDVVLDGSLNFQNGDSYAGFKRFKLSTNPFQSIAGNSIVTKHDGKLIPYGLTNEQADIHSIGNDFNISVSNLDTGFSETYSPITNEVKAYFNGWQAKTLDENGKPTTWRSIVDGTDAPTQTLAYVSANKAPGYIPYKLSYVLATSQISEAKAEGAISVNGPTQIEVGSGVIIREKVNPIYGNSSNDYYYVNGWHSSAFLKNTPLKILNIYKDNQSDLQNWGITSTNVAAIRPNKFDSNANYYFTYVVYDRNQFTTNALTASATFATNIRTALDDTVKKLEDVKKETSVNSLLLYEMLVRMKAGGI